MKYFAKIDEQNTVIDMTVVDDMEINQLDFPESDKAGGDFLSSLGLGSSWIECSFSGEFRGCYPGVGYSYDPAIDKFIDPRIDHDSFTLNNP